LDCRLLSSLCYGRRGGSQGPDESQRRRFGFRSNQSQLDRSIYQRERLSHRARVQRFGSLVDRGTVGVDAHTYASTGLTASTTYYYRVFATSSTGDSTTSNVSYATTAAAPVAPGPTAPSSLQATAVTFLQINLTWVDNATNETGFKVERATSTAGPWMQIGTPGVNATSYSAMSLNPTTTYYFRVRATNGSGDSAYSPVGSATTPAAPPPNPTAPSNLTATATSSSQINLTWTDTTAYESGYVVERYTGSYWIQVASLAVNATSYSNTGLSASTAYSYRVAAMNAAGTLFYGPSASATTQSSAPSLPAAPSSLTATVVSSSQINLTWVDNSANETGFYVERATSTAGPWTTIATTGSNAVAFSSTGLTASTAYYFRARSFNTSGSSAYTPTVSASTSSSGTVPAAPSGLTATAASSSQINLTWIDNASNEQGFSIERSSSASGPWSVIATTASTTYSNTGLTASTAYSYRVRAYNTAGNSAYTGTATTTTAGGGGSTDTVKPTGPATVTTTSPTCGAIKISWTQASDLGGSGLRGYNVYRKNETTPFAQALNATTLTDNGLSSATFYYYQIEAVDNAGNKSAKTAAVGVYTQSCAGTGGTYDWATHSGGSIAPDEGMAIAADSAGNSYVTGDFNGSAAFGSITLNSAGTRDVFVAKYGVNGTVAWAKRFGGPYDDIGESIAVDASGNVVVTGRFQGTADLGAGMASAGGYDIFLAKYSGIDGRLLWSKRIGGTGSDEGAAVAVDSSGNIFLTGQFFGSVDFGGGAATNASSYVQAFLAKYSTDGAFVWAKRFGKLLATAPATSGSGRSVAVDPSGNVIMAGNYYGAVDFGSGPLSVFGGTDVYVGKFAGSDGHCLWSKGFGDPSDQHATSVASDVAGNVILTGDFLDSINFGGSVLPSSAPHRPFSSPSSTRTGSTSGHRASSPATSRRDPSRTQWQSIPAITST
jgi:fibronectin type 3 domain-containing protein